MQAGVRVRSHCAASTLHTCREEEVKGPETLQEAGPVPKSPPPVSEL